MVVATTDRAATAEFLAALGFEPAEAGFAVPGGAAVHIELTDTDAAPRGPRDYEHGPRALDIYTSDIERGTADLSDAGYEVSPIGTISMGPVTMRQALVIGPDGFPVVLVESTHRRSSILDREPDRLFSEPHSVVWCVPDRDAEAERWEAAGFTRGTDLSFEEPAVSEYLGLPDSPVPILMTMLSNEAVDPVRLELLEFPSETGADDQARLAIQGLRFAFGDGQVPAELQVGATGRTPGGVSVTEIS